MEQQTAIGQQSTFPSKTDQPLAGKEEILFSWRGPVRPFKVRSRQFFSTVVLVALLLSIIGFVLEGLMVVVLTWAVVFLVFVLFLVPPEEVTYEITTKNVVVAGKKYSLEEISRFWIAERFGHTLLIFDTPLKFPGRLELVLSPSTNSGQVEIDNEEVKRTLEDLIEYGEGTPGFTDRAASWLSKHLSLDKV